MAVPSKIFGRFFFGIYLDFSVDFVKIFSCTFNTTSVFLKAFRVESTWGKQWLGQDGFKWAGWLAGQPSTRPPENQGWLKHSPGDLQNLKEMYGAVPSGEEELIWEFLAA